MAETATTRPARTRTRAAAKPAESAAKPPTAAKATPPKAPAAKPAAAPQEATTVTRFKVELEHVDTTKSYEKFAFPDSYKGTVVGNVYAPIGTSRVAVLIIGADDTED